MRLPFNNISLQWLARPPWFPPAREPPQTICTLKKTMSENLTSAIAAVTLLKRVREVITFAYFLRKDILLALIFLFFECGYTERKQFFKVVAHSVTVG